jgi:ribose 5-phosphate isomerase B
MKIFLGSDHAGFEMKNELKKFLEEFGYEVKDLGDESYKEKDDYPDFVFPVAQAVAKDPKNSRGIILGGSGQGEAMVANRVKGVRAAVIYDYNENIVILSREHNDANILSLGARFIDLNEAKSAIRIWLETPFSEDERHKRRIAKIDQE